MNPKEELWLEGLKQGRPMCFRPLGSSMVPFLRNGDVVTIVAGSGRIGDIVLTQSGAALLLHRLVAQSGHRLVTKGDALDHLDPPIAPSQVLGTALNRERHGRTSGLNTLTARLAGLAFCLTLPFFPRMLAILARLKRLVQPGRSIG